MLCAGTAVSHVVFGGRTWGAEGGGGEYPKLRDLGGGGGRGRVCVWGWGGGCC